MSFSGGKPLSRPMFGIGSPTFTAAASAAFVAAATVA
eukprot:CAMPEP_0179082558 /NCGR_PEP_ID=MMETSP0796-20121207/37231_1 /TAXON_ID=73915 /ORGANISM="Pyrodinium bahamense, Strain pbaha01" /LENGTH=36 /DNA_ID= /DNA_START= /DNA_END= /DNA_ORIENTATION=